MNFKRFGRTAQLFDYQNMASGTTGKYLNDSGEEIVSSIWDITGYIPCDGMNFTVASLGGNTPSICLYDGNKTFIAGQAYNSGGGGTKTAITISSETQAKYIRFSYLNGTVTSPDDLSAIMLNEGLVALPYQPYMDWTNIPHYIMGADTDTITTLPADLYADGTNATVGLVGNMSQTGAPTPQNPIAPSECGDLETTGEHAGQYKIPISSGGVTTPVYLGEVQSTRRVKKLVLTGDETWKSTGGIFYLETLENDYLRASNIITAKCSHYGSQTQPTGASGVEEGNCVFGNTTSQRMYIRDTSISGSANYKTYLQQQYTNGTPVTVWYVLATETTGIVNEPLRKIGDYADTVSGITIPTITGADSFDVLTTLKPSEVSLAYTGWHDATVKEWDGSEWD